MRYQMHEKWLSIGDDFVIEDEGGRRAFYVDGKVLTIRKTLVMNDAAGNEVAVIRKKLLSIGTTYNVERGGRTAATVHKKMFTLFRAVFTVDVPGPDDLEAKGDFLDHSYSFYRGGRQVASVSKKWIALRDRYGIDIEPGEDAVLILASAVVIDLCMHPDDED